MHDGDGSKKFGENLERVIRRENQRLRQELLELVRKSHKMVYQYQKKLPIVNNND